MSDLFITRTASFGPTNAIRYSLGRDWGEASRVLFIGHNGSKADDERDDMTVCRWMQFARAWGYGGMRAVNLYPFMDPDPEACRRWAAEKTLEVVDSMAMNLNAIGREAKRADLIVACWGAIAQDPAVVDAVLAEIGNRTIYCFGTTAGGAPIHPMARGRMRVADDARPIVWRQGGALAA